MQRYFAKDFTNNYFLLNDDDIYHIKTVMRMKDNDKIEVVYNNKLYIGIIEDITNIKIRMHSEEQVILDNRPNVILCIPLLKEQKIDFILQKATELGVNEIIPINLERSIIKIDNKDFDKKKVRWERIIKEASEQSKRVDKPIIRDLHNLSELNIEGLKIVCSTTEKENNIKKVLKSKTNNIIFVIGPEGGLSKKEEEQLQSMGYILTSLGNRIMRVETVPLYLMSIVNYEFME